MLLPLAATSIATMTLLLFFAGLPIAPVVAAVYGQVGRVAAEGSVAGAFSWFGTAISIGIATGSVVGGVLIDAGSWRWSALLGSRLRGGRRRCDCVARADAGASRGVTQLRSRSPPSRRKGLRRHR
jgi:MFS family permease